MSELISRDYLLDTISSMIAYHNSASDVYDMVEDAPTVDAIPVIRCKDCKHAHYTDYFGLTKNMLVCDRHLGQRFGTELDNYCSWAERKEE